MKKIKASNAAFLAGGAGFVYSMFDHNPIEIAISGGLLVAGVVAKGIENLKEQKKSLLD